MFNLAPSDIPISIVTFLMFVAIGAIWDLGNEVRYQNLWAIQFSEWMEEAYEKSREYKELLLKHAPHALKPRDAKGRWL